MSVIPNNTTPRTTHRISVGNKQTSGLAALIEARPQLEWVRVGDLQVDHRYQRDNVSATRVAEIAENFDEELFFAIAVNLRDDGTLFVYDGQHRMLAVLERFGPDRLVPAFVTFGLTPEREARLFHAMQTFRKPVTPLERFKAQLFRGDPAAVAINTIVENAGFVVNIAGKGGRGLQCVSAIELLYYPGSHARPDGSRTTRASYMERDPDDFGPQWAGPGRLIWTLTVLALAYRYNEIITGPLVDSVGVLWTPGQKMPRGIDQQRLAEAIRYRTPKGWLVHRKEKRQPIWVLIAEQYNKGLKGRNRIPTAKARAEQQEQGETAE